MLDAVATPPPLIIVEEAASHQPAIFLGFMAVGSETDMIKLEERASQLKFPARRATNDRNEPEVMIMFPPGTDHRAGLQIYRDALGGRFGPLKLEVVIISKEKAKDGIDLEKDASAESPSFITIPGS